MHIFIVLQYLLIFIVVKCSCCEKLENKKTLSNSSQIEPKASHNNSIINDEEVYKWSSSNYPEPYNDSESAILVIQTESSYSIVIEITDLDLNSDEGDFLMIKSGDKETAEGEGKLFTYLLKKPRKYFFHSNSVYIRFQVSGCNKDKRGFQLTYQRIGEARLTTTESPSTSITWPTPSPEESNYFRGNLFGKTLQDFTNQSNIDNFKNAMVESATEYCDSHNVKRETITTKNIVIHYIIQCPFSWPNSHICTQINFSLPIILEEETSEWKGYQLKSERLEDMWINYAGSFLDKYNMQIYSEPDNKTNYIKWLTIFCSILAILLLLPCIVTVIANKFSPARISKDSSSLSTTELRSSQPSLGQSRFQPTPPIFENEDYFHEFEFDMQKPQYSEQTDWLTDDISDDEVVVGQFNNNKNDVVKNGNNKLDWPASFQTFQ